MNLNFRPSHFIHLVAAALTLTIATGTSAFEVKLTADQYALEQNNWDGTSHAQGASRVGGYLRNPLTAFDYETLAMFDVSDITGNVKSATLRFNVTGGNSGGAQSVYLYAQDLVDGVDTETVSYSTFCDSATTSRAWSSLLGSTTANGATPGWVEIGSDTLAELVNNWIADPDTNDGLVLTGNFYFYGYAIEINAVELLVEVEGRQWEIFGDQTSTLADFDETNSLSAAMGPGNIMYIAANGEFKSCIEDCIFNQTHLFSFDGTDWDAEALPIVAPINERITPTIKIAPDGTPYVIARGDEGLEIWAKEDADWEFITELPEGYTGSKTDEYAVDMSPDGSIFAVATDSKFATLLRFDGASWEVVSGKGFYYPEHKRAKVAAGPNGSALIAQELGDSWSTPDEIKMFYHDGTNWQGVGSLVESDNALSDFEVAIGPDGTLYAAATVFTSNTPPAEYRVYQYDGADWVILGDPVELGAAGMASWRYLTVSPDGTLHTSYTQHRSATPINDSLGKVAAWNGSEWVDYTTMGLMSSTPRNCVVVFDDAGEPYVAIAPWTAGLSAKRLN